MGCDICRTIQPSGSKRRNRRLLVTTKMLEEAMAALATMGDSSHDIASGIGLVEDDGVDRSGVLEELGGPGSTGRADTP
jgi:hypothetical protein